MSDQYARAAAKIAAAQLAEAAGFDAVEKSSLEVLSELLLQYINEIGTAAHSYAEIAGRTDANALDVRMALTDLGVSLDELREYAALQEDIPFAQTIASFPVKKKPSAVPTFADKGEVPPRHVPAFLPAFPDRHTYVSTPAYPQNELKPAERQAAAAEAQHEAQKALAKLRAREDPRNKLAQVLVGGAQELEPQQGGGAGSNPFFMRPLWEGQALGEAPAAAGGPDGGAGADPMAVDGQDRSGGAPAEEGPVQAGAKPPAYAPWDVKSTLTRQVELAASGSQAPDAFGDDAAAKGSRRQRRPGGTDLGTKLWVDDLLEKGGAEEIEGGGLEEEAAPAVREQI